MTVRRLPAVLLALCLGALCSFALACGQDREGLIASSRAQELQDNLDKIDEYVAAGRCDAVAANLEALRRRVNDLPGSVDRQLRQRLRTGVDRLETQAPEDCAASKPQTTTTTTDTTPAETIPPDTTPVETVPPPTTPAVTTPSTTTPPPTTPPAATTPTTTPGASGGDQAPSGQAGTP